MSGLLVSTAERVRHAELRHEYLWGVDGGFYWLFGQFDYRRERAIHPCYELSRRRSRGLMYRWA